MTEVRIRQAVASAPFPRWHLLTVAGPEGGLDNKIVGSQNRFAEFQHLWTVVDAQHNEGFHGHILGAKRIGLPSEWIPSQKVLR
jgi:hypothetical protein